MADSMTVKSIKGQIDVYKRNLKNTGPNTIGRRNAEKQIKRLQTRLKRLQKSQPKVVETEAIFDKKPTSAQRARKTMNEKARQIKKTTTEVPRETQSKAAALAAISFLPPALLTGKFAPLVASVKALGTGEKLTQGLQNRINKVVKEFKGKPPKAPTKIPPTKASRPKADKPKKPIGPSVKGIKPLKVTTKRPPPRVTSGTGTRVTAPLPKVKPPAKSKVPTRLKKVLKTTDRTLKRNAPAIKTAAATAGATAAGALSPKPVKAKDPIYRNIVTKKPDRVRPDEDLPMSEEGKTITTGKKRKSLFDAMLGDPMKTGDFSAKDQIVKNPFTGEDMELKYEYPDDPDDGMKKGGSIKKNMKKKKAKTKVKKRAALRGYGKALRGF